MKKIALSLVALLATLPMLASAADYSATVVAGHPPIFRWVQMLDKAFAPGVNAALAGSGHSFAINGQYGGAIAAVGDELETVEAGLAELGICQSLFDPAKLAVLNVTYYTPFVSADPRLVNNLMDKLQREDQRMAAPWAANGVVYIGAPIGIDDYLLMTNFPVRSLADLEGRKIAAPGPAINWLSGTGAVGVAGNLTTYYNELQTGVYDGVIVFASAALPGRLYEVAPYITRFGLGAQYAGGICANADWYQALPTEVQAALHSGADAAQDWYISALEAAVANAFSTMAANGATISDASLAMRSAWAQGMDNAAQQWAQALDAQGQPGSAILALYMDMMRAAGAEPLRAWDEE